MIFFKGVIKVLIFFLFSLLANAQTTVTSSFGTQNGVIGPTGSPISYTSEQTAGFYAPLRIYAGTRFTVSSSGPAITSISITYDSSTYFGASQSYVAGVSSSSTTSVTGTGSSPTRTFAFTQASGTKYFALNASAQTRLSSISVTYASSNTITTGAITGSPFCVTTTAGTTVSVPFTSTGTFNSGNTFTAQLSNASGVFTTPLSTATGTSPINLSIPANTPTGTGYKIRVISSNPSTTGTESAAFTVNLARNSIASTTSQSIPEGVNGTALTVTEQSTAISRVWKYTTTSGSGYTTFSTAQTGTAYTPNFPATGTYYVVCESTFACGVARSNEVIINVAKPTITISGTPSLFTYAQSQGPSASQSVTVAGSNLAANIILAVPSANWEISTNAGFTAPASAITLAKNASNAVSSTTIYIRLKAGLLQGQYDFSTDDDFQASSTNAITKFVNLDGEVTEPKAELTVKGVFAGGTTSSVIPNGDITPSTLDNTEFAAQNIGASQVKTFRLENVGGLALDISSISLDNTSDFFVTASAPYNIAGASYQDFTITFRPASIGNRNALVTILSSDLTDPSYTFTLLGVGRNAEIGVAGNGNDIPNGNTAISATNNTLIGSANANSANATTASKSFVISNTGNIALVVSAINITGVDASQFSVSPVATSVAAGSTGTFVVTFSPSSAGIKNAVISIANNDATDNENPYTFAVQGNASSYIACAVAEAINYQTGFESAEDFEPDTTYNNTSVVYTGAAGQQWGTYYGTPSTTTPIVGSQSMQMRWYTTATANRGYTFTNFNISNPTKVVFSAANTAGINVIVSYSVNNGTTWLGDQTFTLSTTATDYTYNLPVSIASARIRFLLTYTTAPSGTSRLYIDNVRIYQAVNNTKTWNGTTWSGDGLPPTASQKAVINGNFTLPYTIGGTTYTTLESCECQVNAGRVINIGTTDDVTKTSVPANVIIQGKIENNGNMVLASGSNLIQLDPLAENTFANNFVAKRFSKLPKMGYTYWSSPVSSQNLYVFSNGGQVGGTPKNRFWLYDEASNLFKNTGAFLLNDSSVFVPGRGYAIRGMDDFGATTPVLAHDFTFTGAPNNGDISLPSLKWTNNDKGYNLVGNPYPSNIDFDALYEANSAKIHPIAYFWTNNDLSITQQQANYGGNNYAIYNQMGGSPATYVEGDPNEPSSATLAPTNVIRVGQGFIIKTQEGMNNQSLDFTNAIRLTDNGVFFNNKLKVEKDRFWLKMVSPVNIINTILLGYSAKATNGYELAFDTELFQIGSDSFYSLLDSKKLGIQGRASFTKDDKVGLGNVYVQNGNYKIMVADKEGVFANGQSIYLKDKLLNKVIDITNADYTFQAVKGTDHTRFEILYKPEDILSVSANSKSDLVVYKDQNVQVVKSSKKLGKIEIYDASGKLVRTLDVNGAEVKIDTSAFLNGVYILKVENSGDLKTKKFIK